MKDFFKRPGGHDTTDERIGPVLGEALESLPKHEECPHPEDIAALSEGKITGDAREHLLLHLAGCDRCRTAYSMVCDIAKAELPAVRADFRWQARRLVPLAAAAGLILVIVSWPLLSHRESGVNEAVSPYIQKPADSVPQKYTTATPETVKTRKDRHSETNDAKPKTEASTPEYGKRENAPVLAAEAAPRPEVRADRPLVPVPAKEKESANATSPSMEPPKPIETGMAKSPTPAGQSKIAPAPPAGDGSSLALSRTTAGAPREVPGFEPRFISAPLTKSAESPAEPLNFHRKVEIDEGQRLRLSKADAATSDKVKIEGIFKDLKLDTCGFPLQDINKVVVQWTGAPRRKGQLGVDEGATAAGAQPGEKEKVQANVSLEDNGVLTINVQGTPILRKNRGAKIPVGC